jgi:hypothetical protein
MSTIKNQHNYSSRRGYIKKRKGRSIFYPSFLTKCLKQEVQEYQDTIDFLENHYGEAAAQKLCQKPAEQIVLLNAVIVCLEELQELQEIQAKQSEPLDLKLETLRSGQASELKAKTKTET